MGRKVYIVTEGIYSDYGILAVFSSRKKAEEFIKLYKKYCEFCDEIRIEEYERDKEPEEYIYVFIRMDRDGNVKQIYKVILGYEEAKLYASPSKPRFDVDGNMFLYVRTDDEKKAIKVANEVRTRLIALGRWGL